MIKIGDIITESAFRVYRVIGVEDDYVTLLLLEDINGPVDQDEDNIGDFILLNDIYDPAQHHQLKPSIFQTFEKQ